MSLTYKQSGVDIDADSESVRRIKDGVKTTHDSNVLAGLGSFGALYDLSLIKNYKQPILVQSIDGVGTKVKIAFLMGKYSGLGEDIVNHSCNDIVCQGAKPLTFLDYIASFKTEPKIIEEIVSGMVKACKEAGVSLIGGETAEMSTVYAPNERDIAGCITGIVEKDEIITGKDIKVGDIALGLQSSGLHTNGFSLVRKIFSDEDLKGDLGEEALKPHKNYSKNILKVLEQHQIKGIAHITGGGLIENPPRILPEGMALEIRKDSWEILPIFKKIQSLGDIDENEMYRVFNMGIGMILVVSPNEGQKIKTLLEFLGEKVFEIGKVVRGNKEVILS
ncbi:MAG: phosphoribosylformylglycinamidine cyclo-ligase [Candidatus Doudnabacteria bacterium]|nr:phosphoribosylformylglycinamidine cyclo-ligase [Candidatus Doudnabacteria bacterium]